MPELPEVEVVRRGLTAILIGQTIRQVTVRDARLRWPVPDDLSDLLQFQRLQRTDRRSKYLLLEFDAGTLIVHLGMSGTLTIAPIGSPPGKHDHVDLLFDEALLRFHDPRRFGAVLWHDRDAGPLHEHRLLAGLGLEPFDAAFDAAALKRVVRGRKLAIKQLLLSGAAVVGVGNIYASESLFQAGIRPGRAAGSLTLAECSRLVDAVRGVLARAIERGGSSLRDFVAADGATGHFQLECFVYGRAGLPCRRCGTVVRQRRQQQRSTYYCAHCQR
jgi:formamidopyrimidine-DNA glycosylase